MDGPVFVTGGSGFVGDAVLRELRSRGIAARALVHRRPIEIDGVVSVPGSVTDSDAVREAMKGCAAVIHLVGIIRERPKDRITFEQMHFVATKVVATGARDNGINRLVHMSALGTRPDAVSDYHKTKWQAEEYLRKSPLDWTTLRPSMIHGPRGEFTKMEAAWARGQSAPFLFMPYFGRGVLGTGGAGNLQPVFVDDVARAFVDALDRPNTIKQTYPLAGPAQMTWTQLHRAMAQAVVGKPRATFALPAWYARVLTRIAPAKWLPFNHDQVVMSQEDNTADIAPFVSAFGWTPRSFDETLKGYARDL